MGKTKFRKFTYLRDFFIDTIIFIFIRFGNFAKYLLGICLFKYYFFKKNI